MISVYGVHWICGCKSVSSYAKLPKRGERDGVHVYENHSFAEIDMQSKVEHFF